MCPTLRICTGWYTLGGATATTGAYDTGQYNKARWPPAIHITVPRRSPLFYSSADAHADTHGRRRTVTHEWVAKGLRTWLEDAANQLTPGPLNEHAWLPNLQYIVLLGDATRVAPSFYYYYHPFVRSTPPNNRWLPTDFFYRRRRRAPAPATGRLHHVGTKTGDQWADYQVSRIPVRAAPYMTVDQSAASSRHLPLIFGPPYYDPLPFLSKIRDYCDILNSLANGDVAKNHGFHQLVQTGRDG